MRDVVDLGGVRVVFRRWLINRDSTGRSMKITTASRMKLVAISAGLAFGIFGGKSARADRGSPMGDPLPIIESQGWSVYTLGRVDAFLSYGWGDGLPIPRPGETIPDGAGLDPGSDTIPQTGPNGKSKIERKNITR